MEAGKSNKLWRSSQELMLQFKSKGYQAAEFLLAEVQSFVLFRASTGCPHYGEQSALLKAYPF